MPRLSVDDLQRIREGSGRASVLRSGKARAVITIHMGTCGIKAGAGEIMGVLLSEIEKEKISDVIVSTSDCAGLCSREPMATVEVAGQPPVKYVGLKPEGIVRILRDHALGGRIVTDYALASGFAKQRLFVLRNRGLIDPEKIEDYIAADGYAALEKALFHMTAEQIISEIKKSGLRGRGGGGFPAGVKWETCRRAAQLREVEPVLVCNADEGDPGAFTDRSIIEIDPHSALEGMIIGARAIGCKQGFIYIRDDYHIARERLLKAADQARDCGLLGNDILGSGMDFDIEVVQGAGGFVFMESTALMAFLEGNAGEPRAKYVNAVEYGYENRPTNLNNVETLANVPLVIRRGAEWFSSMGTGSVAENTWNGSSGTKVFSMGGKINNSGLIEIPMGTTLREIIFEIGAGIPKERRFKAVRTGGPLGGCLPESHLDMPVDFDNFTEAGSMMGSGGMIVMDDQACMVDVARDSIAFLAGESCGKCTPCREGLRTSLETLNRITQGKGTPGDLELMQEMGEVMQDCCLCALGTSAQNTVLSTIRYFKDEYDAHINDHQCPAGVCKELIEYMIDPVACDGCHACVHVCSAGAILGETKQPHALDKTRCLKCGACIEECKQEAIRIVPRSHAA